MNTYTIRMPEDAGIKYNIFKYPAGETQVRLTTETLHELRTTDKVIVVATKLEGEIMSLALLTDALIHNNPFHADLTLVLPYLPYSRADRRFVEGDCFGLRTLGNIIDGFGYDRVITLDAHSHVAHKAIHNLTNVNPHKLIIGVSNIIQYQNAANGGKNKEETTPVILFPDKGAKERYIAENFPGSKILYCEKKRDAATGKLSGFQVPSKDKFGKAKSVLIVDDICDGGGTFIGIADELFKLQDWNINLYLYVTHGIFSKGFDDLKNHFMQIYTSDSFGERDKKDVSVITSDPSWYSQEK